MTKLPIPVLSEFIGELLNRAGLPAKDATFLAGEIVGQEARGIVTHGLRLVEYHVTGLATGTIKPQPDIRILSDNGTTVVFDTDSAAGIIGAMHAMDGAVERAKRFGVGIGIAAYGNYGVSTAPYCRRAAEQGMLGIAMSNTQRVMGYPGARGRVIGNNPFGFAAPTGAGFPIVFDAAMTISGGMLSRLVREGQEIPRELMALDAEGKPTQNPKEARTPMPIGGNKGAGLALLVEILTGVLSGGAFLSSVVPSDKRKRKQDAQTQCCIAIEIERFMPLADFQERMVRLISDLKDNELAPGATEIRVPGERMSRHLEQCRRDGVPIEPDVRENLETLAKQAGVKSPF